MNKAARYTRFFEAVQQRHVPGRPIAIRVSRSRSAKMVEGHSRGM